MKKILLFALAWALLIPITLPAQNLIQQNQGTLITWADSGATHVITLKGLATNTGRQGAEHDFGVAAVATRFIWLAQVQFDTGTTPVVGETVDIYLKRAPDGDNYDNDDGNGTDIAVSAEDKLKNLQYLGSIIVDEAAVDVPMQASGMIEIGAEKVQPVFWNATADTLDDDVSTTDLKFILVSIPLEVQ